MNPKNNAHTESEESTVEKTKGGNKWFRYVKIAISFGLLFLVFFQLDFSAILNHVKQMSIGWFLLAILLFVLSQVLSVSRLQLFFNSMQMSISWVENAKLYLVGMYYNFFIPGGTGGDAYKVVVLKKHYKVNWKKLTAAIFLDRLLGLGAIFILLVFIAVDVLAGVPSLKNTYFEILLVLVWPMVYILGILFKEFKRQLWPALAYSVVIQVLQMGSVVALLLALGVAENISIYVGLFLVSVVLSIVSFAGLGVREYVFYQAALWLNFQETTGVTVALLFNLITLGVSLFGLIYVVKGLVFGTKKPPNGKVKEYS